MFKKITVLALCLSCFIFSACTEQDPPPIETSGDTDTESGTQISPVYQSFYTETDGYGVSAHTNATGMEFHSFYHTSDAGKTWLRWETDPDTVYPGVITGIRFKDESLGFIVYRHWDDSFTPPIVKTADGGKTWERQTSICELLKEYADQSYMLQAKAPQFHEDGRCTIDLTGIRHNDGTDTDDVVYLTIESTDCETWTVTKTEKETNVTVFASPVGDYYIMTSQVGMLGMATPIQDYGNIRLTKGYYGTVLCTTDLVTRNIDVQWSEDGAYAVISHGISGYGRDVDLVDVAREAFLDLPGSLEVKKAVVEDQISAETFSTYAKHVFVIKELPTAESEQITVTFFFSHPTSTDGVLGSYVYDLREKTIVSIEAAIVSKTGIPDEMYP